jgi:hypothetical protein
LTAAILLSASAMASGEQPLSFSTGTVNRADIVVKSVRLTDNGDNDGLADPNETVNLYVTLRNSSGADRDGIVVTVGTSDATVECIPSPVIAFGSLLAGQERESTVAATLRVANVARSDAFASLTAILDFQISGDGFGGTARRQQVVLDLDLNASGGLLPTTFTEGFEGAGLGTFTTQSLDVGRESLAGSDGHRCQYNDPDFVNSNSSGNTYCFLGGATPSENGYDWHVHGVGSPDGGRAYLGNNALHWGVHAGPASADTTRLKQLDAIRNNLPVNLGWNGVTSELSFKQQVALADCDYLHCPDHFTVDRGIVQVQMANSAGQGLGNWRTIAPYENVYDSQVVDWLGTTVRECTFDPTDDGNTEDDYFDPTDPYRRLGPSSTCSPEFAFSRLGATLYTATFDPSDVGHASDAPGLQGSHGPGTWVQTKFDLSRYRGRRIRFRFLATSMELGSGNTWLVVGFPPNSTQVDDGWYIDDIRVTNTLTSGATVSVDQADRSGLPACGPVCGSLTASLVASPPTVGPGEPFTLDASGSAADQCPGGTVLYRFWWDQVRDGLLGPYDFVLQEWGANAMLTRTTPSTAHYFVDVRCSTTPACNSRALAVVPFVCPAADLEPLPVPILWASDTEVVWDAVPYTDAIRGDLGALRASQGQFNGTVLGCMGNQIQTASGDVFTRFTDADTPLPGEAFYYLVRQDNPCRSWSTLSPAEVPGAGGNRDIDLAYDPHICPSYY